MDESLANTSWREALIVLMPTLRDTVAVSNTMKFIRFNLDLKASAATSANPAVLLLAAGS